MPGFFMEEPGAALSVTIDRHVDVMVRRSRNKEFVVRADTLERLPCAEAIESALIRESLLAAGTAEALDITVASDTRTTGSGLGSSGALVTALLLAVHARSGHHCTPAELARQATEVEIGRCGRAVGLQDQYTSAYGGLISLTFVAPGRVDVERIQLDDGVRAELERSLVLVDTCQGRDSGSVLAAQQRRLSTDRRWRSTVRRMAELANEMKTELEKGRTADLGAALHEGWVLKRSLLDPGWSAADALYERGRDAGAEGGKLLGAGEGGHMLFAVPASRRAQFMAAMSDRGAFALEIDPKGARLVTG